MIKFFVWCLLALIVAQCGIFLFAATPVQYAEAIDLDFPQAEARLLVRTSERSIYLQHQSAIAVDMVPVSAICHQSEKQTSSAFFAFDCWWQGAAFVERAPVHIEVPAGDVLRWQYDADTNQLVPVHKKWWQKNFSPLIGGALFVWMIACFACYVLRERPYD
jgi:hypothetical protein